MRPRAFGDPIIRSWPVAIVSLVLAMRPIGALLVAAACLTVPSSAAAAAPALDWSVGDRLRGSASIDMAVPLVPLTVRADVGGDCPAHAAFELDGRAIAAKRSGGCGFELPATLPGRHRLTLSAGDREVSAEMDVRDHLVVSIGDSVASGEGNPGAIGAAWLERRCHRSLRSGAAFAARAAELGDRHSAISFVPLACSGATVDHGLLGPYDGIEKDSRKGPLSPQVDELLALERPVEALLVSAGANDVHFGALVRFCMSVRDCQDRHFNPRHASAEAGDAVPTAAELERTAVARLAGRYDAPAARLRGRIDPARVLVVEYFDPLRDGRVSRASTPCPA